MPAERKLRMTAMRSAPVVAMLLATILVTSGARAQDAADVSAGRDLFIQGSQLAQQDKWNEAREAYAASLGLKRAAITLYSLGLAEKHTGMFVEALEHFRAFLAEPSTPATKRYQKPSKAAIADLEKRVASLSISVRPDGAPGLEIRIDGQPVPAESLVVARLVNPGKHEIVASARGFKEARANVEPGEGEQRAVELVMQPAPEIKAPVISTPPPLAPAAPPAAPQRINRATPPSRAAPIALMGIGGAIVVGGAVVGLMGVSDASDAPTRDGPEANDARVKMHVGDILAGAGVATAAVGLVWLIASGSAPSDKVGVAPRRGLVVRF